MHSLVSSLLVFYIALLPLLVVHVLGFLIYFFVARVPGIRSTCFFVYVSLIGMDYVSII